MSALEIYPVAEILVAWGGLRRCLIVTALETELLAVQAHLSEVKSAVGDNGTIYECGLFSTGAEDWLIVLPTGDMGNAAAQHVVSTAIHEFKRFKLVLFSGIAGSRKQDLPIGSLVASSYVHTPYPGKITFEGLQARPSGRPIDSGLVSLAKKVCRDRRWVTRLLPPVFGAPLPAPDQWPNGWPPAAVVKPIIAGEVVSTDPDSEFEKHIDLHYGDAHAIEMEGYGAVFAADHARIPIMVVRGISDLRKNKSAADDANYQPLAASVAAAFSFEFLVYWATANREAPVETVLESGPATISPADEPATDLSVKTGDIVSTKTTLILNFDAEIESFTNDVTQQIATLMSDVVGGAVEVVSIQSGSVRLFVETNRPDILRERIDEISLAIREKYSFDLIGVAEADIFRNLEAVKNSFFEASQDLLAWPKELFTGERLERPELLSAIERIRGTESSVTIVTGEPGSGKSALLSEISALSLSDGYAVLAIKADTLHHELSSQADLAKSLELNRPVADLVLQISAFNPVLVVIDQLDALASYVDLTTRRLSVLLNLVRKLANTRNVHILMSSRTFELEHDVRLKSIAAERLILGLPTWPEVNEVLARYGFPTAAWPSDAQELLRSPQALSTFLRLNPSAEVEPFVNYQALLDALWRDQILNHPQGGLLSSIVTKIAQEMSDVESLWLARSRFDQWSYEIDLLVSKRILAENDSGRAISFSHQTLFDHALARSFVSEPGSLSRLIAPRMDSLFVRPKVWAGLTYLRDLEPQRYEAELFQIWRIPGLPKHLKFLLLDFVGRQAKSALAQESELLDAAVSDPVFKAHALRAIVGSPLWFERYKATVVPAAMSDEKVLEIASDILVAAWAFDPSSVDDLLLLHWANRSDRSNLTWFAISRCPKWSDLTFKIASIVINRENVSPTAVDHVVSVVGVNQPAIAGALVQAKVSKDLEQAISASRLKQTKQSETDANDDYLVAWGNSPTSPISDLFSAHNSWYSVVDLAQAAPEIVSRSLWPIYKSACEHLLSLSDTTPGEIQFEAGHVISLNILDDSAGILEGEITTAFRTSLEQLATSNPGALKDWLEDATKLKAHPVQCLVAHIYSTAPEYFAEDAFKFFVEDQRRFVLGGSDGLFDVSCALVASASVWWSPKLRMEFVELVRGYRPPPPDRMTTPQLRRSFASILRRLRFELLSSLPRESMDEALKAFLLSEERSLGTRKIGTTFTTGAIGSPVPRIAFEKGDDEDILKLFAEVPDDTDWDHPTRHFSGGSIQLSREFAEFAKENAARAIELIRQLSPSLSQRPAGYALQALAEVESPETVISLFIELNDSGFNNVEYRHSAADAVRRLHERKVRIPQNVISVLELWLREYQLESEEVGLEDDVTGEEGDRSTDSVLWGYGGYSVLPGGSYPILSLLITVLLKDGEHARIMNLIKEHLKREPRAEVWRALLHYITFLRVDPATDLDQLVCEILDRHPSILHSREGANFLGRYQWRNPQILKKYVKDLAKETHWLPKQVFGEIVALIAIVQPKVKWAQKELQFIFAAEASSDVRVGAAYSAANLWPNRKNRDEAMKVIAALLPKAEFRTWYAAMDLFRVVDELPPDNDTAMLLNCIIENVGEEKRPYTSELVDSLQKLLPNHALLVGELTRKLVENWGSDLADFRSSIATSAADLVDLAVTLHRLGPETRELGTRLFEELLALNAHHANQTLAEIDRRFPLNRSAVLPRLRRTPRSKKRRRRLG